jgi:hypothetical protein
MCSINVNSLFLIGISLVIYTPMFLLMQLWRHLGLGVCGKKNKLHGESKKLRAGKAMEKMDAKKKG